MQEEEIDMRDFVRTLVKWRKLIGIIFVSTITIGVIVIIVMKFMPKSYESKAIIVNGVVEKPIMDMSRVEIILKSNDFLDPVVTAYNEEYNRKLDALGLGSLFKIENIDAITFKIFAKSHTPVQAKSINEKIIARYFEYNRKLFEAEFNALKDKIAAIEQMVVDQQVSIENLQSEMKNFVRERTLTPEPAFKSIMMGNLYTQQLNQLSASREKLSDLQLKLINVKEFRVLNKPTMPQYPSNHIQSKYKLFLMFALIGLFLGVLGAFITEFIQQSKLIDYIKKPD